MIRASKLPILRHCRLAGDLPTTDSDASRLGTETHALVSSIILGQGSEAVPADEAKRMADGLFHWWEPPHAYKALIEWEMELGDVIGHLDVAWEQDGVCLVVDWKTGELEVDPPDDNWQLKAYLLGAMRKLGLDRGKAGICYLRSYIDGEKAEEDPGDWRWSQEYSLAELEDWWATQVRNSLSRPSEASVGGHCSRCYSRPFCPAYRELSLVPTPGAGGVSLATAPRILLAIDALRKIADEKEAEVRALIAASGGSLEWGDMVYTTTNVVGRKSYDVEAMKADGVEVEKYAKRGAPYQRWGWKKR